MIWEWVQDTFWSALSGLADSFMSMLPQSFQVNCASLAGYMAIANCWIPLDLGLSLLLIYWGFVSMFVMIKMVLKLIPWIG